MKVSPVDDSVPGTVPATEAPGEPSTAEGGVARRETELEPRVEKVPAESAGEGPPLGFVDVVKRGDSWRFFPGRIAPEVDWNKPDFDDSSWAVGPSGFGYSSMGSPHCVSESIIRKLVSWIIDSNWARSFSDAGAFSLP